MVQWEYVYCQEGLLMGFLEEKEYALEKRKVKVLGQKYLKGEKKNVGMEAIYARNLRDNEVKESNDEG